MNRRTRPLVSIQKCPDYDVKRLQTKIFELLKPLGGLEHIVKFGDIVLLKPNMLSAKAPEQAVTTHPAIIEVLMERLADIGVRLEIGDSPSGASKEQAEHHWVKTGIKNVADRFGARLRNFEADGSATFTVNGRTYHVAKPVLEADVVINLPKMKTHGLVLMTGAIKNCFGCLPGFQKGEFHKIAPHPDQFSEILVDVFSLVKPAVNIMDGIWSMAGNGPSSGLRRDTGLLLASMDAVALDAVVARIMGFRPEEISTCTLAASRGLGILDREKIEISGVNPADIQLTDFLLPSNRYIKLIPEWLIKVVGKFIWVRPQPLQNTCKRCGICERNCPVHAIDKNDNGFPVIDYTICIKCMCCDESCPYGAIEQKLSWLARKFS